MNRLSLQKQIQIIKLLVEGNSIRGAARIADVSKDTVLSLFVKIGQACAAYQDKNFKNLPCTTLQVDEMHSFVGCREKSRKRGKSGIGTIWVWVAIDAETKLIPCWRLGDRDLGTCVRFLLDLASRMRDKITLISDGFNTYPDAVRQAFGKEINYARIVKIYDGQKYKGATKQVLVGDVAPEKISTCFVERQNLTMRTNIKRFVRKTNAHSKKLDNHGCSVALHFMYYNFCRIHSSLRITPAMAAGVTDRVWEIEELLSLI